MNTEIKLRGNKYKRFVHNSLKIVTMSGSKAILRRAPESQDSSTELLNEIGTTDVAVGDVSLEVMITTPGKIPNEMYYLEDTTRGVIPTTHNASLQETTNNIYAIVTSTEENKSGSGFASHSTILLILLIVLLIILLLCCITACLIARSKRKNKFFGKNDFECEPGCSGINQPLLDKISHSNKSGSSTRN